MTAISNPKPARSMRKIMAKVLLGALIVAAVFLIYMAFRENHRHAQLEASISALQNELKARGINAQKTSGCGRANLEFGQGAKSCSINIVTKLGVKDKEKALAVIKNYDNSIFAAGKFKRLTNIPTTVTNKDNLSFGYINYRATPSSNLCTLDYDFSDSKLLTIGFSCDDTSWFVKTFEG